MTALPGNLRQHQEEIFEENQKDLEAAREKGLSPAMLDRLTLSPATLEQMITGLKEVRELGDPVGEITPQLGSSQRP